MQWLTLCVQAQQNQDNVMWEENRLLQSGVVRRTNVNEEEEKDLVRVQIIVMDIKPPFLDGRMVPARSSLPSLTRTTPHLNYMQHNETSASHTYLQLPKLSLLL